jgi:hypothetical protein
LRILHTSSRQWDRFKTRYPVPLIDDMYSRLIHHPHDVRHHPHHVRHHPHQVPRLSPDRIQKGFEIKITDHQIIQVF